MKKLLVIAAVLLVAFSFIIISVPVSALAGKGIGKMEGLSAPVEIYLDSDGVPHIYAETLEDLVFAFFPG